MKLTKQAKDETILQHGLAVFQHTVKILTGDTNNFRLPSWYAKYQSEIREKLHDYKTIKHYTIWHDISKPYVKTIDAEGKTHYPNHAQKSKEIWDELFPNRPIIGNLIGHDMDFHTFKTVEEIFTQKLTTQDICTLMIVALAELHSNARMFGGQESDSFKIKFKKLQKLGDAVCERLFDHPYVYAIVRNDLSPAQKAVQSGHALIESTRNFNMNGNHPSVILCVVKSEDKLKSVCKELMDKKIKFSEFREPDIGNQLTAIASEPLRGESRDAFKRFQLLY